MKNVCFKSIAVLILLLYAYPSSAFNRKGLDTDGRISIGVSSGIRMNMLYQEMNIGPYPHYVETPLTLGLDLYTGRHTFSLGTGKYLGWGYDILNVYTTRLERWQCRGGNFSYTLITGSPEASLNLFFLGDITYTHIKRYQGESFQFEEPDMLSETIGILHNTIGYGIKWSWSKRLSLVQRMGAGIAITNQNVYRNFGHGPLFTKRLSGAGALQLGLRYRFM